MSDGDCIMHKNWLVHPCKKSCNVEVCLRRRESRARVARPKILVYIYICIVVFVFVLCFGKHTLCVCKTAYYCGRSSADLYFAAFEGHVILDTCRIIRTVLRKFSTTC